MVVIWKISFKLILLKEFKCHTMKFITKDQKMNKRKKWTCVKIVEMYFLQAVNKQYLKGEKNDVWWIFKPRCILWIHILPIIIGTRIRHYLFLGKLDCISVVKKNWLLVETQRIASERKVMMVMALEFTEVVDCMMGSKSK